MAWPVELKCGTSLCMTKCYHILCMQTADNATSVLYLRFSSPSVLLSTQQLLMHTMSWMEPHTTLEVPSRVEHAITLSNSTPIRKEVSEGHTAHKTSQACTTPTDWKQSDTIARLYHIRFWLACSQLSLCAHLKVDSPFIISFQYFSGKFSVTRYEIWRVFNQRRAVDILKDIPLLYPMA